MTDKSVVVVEDSECPECGDHIVKDGDMFCKGCGLVVNEIQIDRGPDWGMGTFEDSQKKSRFGSPMSELYHDKGLSTTIGNMNGDTLSSSQRRHNGRLQFWDNRFKISHDERVVKSGLAEIDRMGSALGTDKVVRETACQLLKQSHDRNMFSGRSIEGIATASLYISLRIHENPRSFEEVAEVSRIEKRRMVRTYKHIVRELELQVEPPSPEDYIPRFVSLLDMPHSIQKQAIDLIKGIPYQHLTGKSPVTLAAGSIYAAGILENYLVKQSRIAEAAEVTSVSVRNRYNDILIHSEESPFDENMVREMNPQELVKHIHDCVSTMHHSPDENRKA